MFQTWPWGFLCRIQFLLLRPNREIGLLTFHAKLGYILAPNWEYHKWNLATGTETMEKYRLLIYLFQPVLFSSPKADRPDVECQKWAGPPSTNLKKKPYILYTTGLLAGQSDNLIVAFLIESPTFQRPLAVSALHKAWYLNLFYDLSMLRRSDCSWLHAAQVGCRAKF